MACRVWHDGRWLEWPSKVEIGQSDRLPDTMHTPEERIAWRVVALAVSDCLDGNKEAQQWVLSPEAKQWAGAAGFKDWPPDWLMGFVQEMVAARELK